MSRHPARGDFDPIPSARRQVEISVASSLPSVEQAAALAVPVASGAEPPADLGTDAAHLRIAGFTGSAGEHLVVPGADGRALVALGIGDASTVDETRVRDLAADFARAVPQHLSLAVELPEGSTAISPADFAQVVVEGIVLARWRYFVGKGGDEPTLTALTIIAPDDVADEVRAGADRGRTIARAAAIARDLANCPATTLTAVRMAEVAEELGPESGLEVDDVRRAAADRDGLRRHPRRQPRQRRRAPADQDDLPPRPADGSPRPGGQGDHVRLRRHQPEAERRVARPDEERHDGCRRDPRRDDRAPGTGLPGRRHGVPVLHRQHAVRLGDEAGRRADHAQRPDRRGAQHRRRGATGDGRRAVPGRGGRRRRRRRHRHPDRSVPAHPGRRGRRGDGQQRRPGPPARDRRGRPPTSRSGSCRSTGPTARSSTRRSPT